MTYCLDAPELDPHRLVPVTLSDDQILTLSMFEDKDKR